MFNKAVNYLNNNRPEKAIPILKDYIKKGMACKEVHLNLGTAYRLLDNDDAAAEHYLIALSAKMPFMNGSFSNDYKLAANNLGLIAYTYEEDTTAEEFYRIALNNDPLYYDALWNLGNCKLRQYCSNKYNSLDKCWRLYEYRFKRTDKPTVLKSKKKLKEWDGRPLDHICVLAEQGYGDQMMFGRYLSLLENRVDKITVQCHERIKSVFSKYDTCDDPIETTAEFGIGICSLANIFNTEIPRGDWLREKYVPKDRGQRLQIGCTWSGNSSHVNNKHRSTNSSYFRGLADLGDLYTLNPTEAGEPSFTALASGSWADSIKALESLDLVICVDTSIAHLCGSLGKPCWVLMPTKNGDFRWGDRSMGFDNIWYPSVRVFRNWGNWGEVFEEVRRELVKL